MLLLDDKYGMCHIVCVMCDSWVGSADIQHSRYTEHGVSSAGEYCLVCWWLLCLRTTCWCPATSRACCQPRCMQALSLVCLILQCVKYVVSQALLTCHYVTMGRAIVAVNFWICFISQWCWNYNSKHLRVSAHVHCYYLCTVMLPPTALTVSHSWCKLSFSDIKCFIFLWFPVLVHSMMYL